MSSQPLDPHGVLARREALGLTQDDLADLSGVSDVTLRKIEHGQHVSETKLHQALGALTRLERDGGAALVHDRRSTDTNKGPNGGPTSSDPAVMVPETVDEGVGVLGGRHVVKVKLAAIGYELVLDYDDPEDLPRVLALANQSIAKLIRERSDSERLSVAEGGDASADGSA